MSTDVTPTNNPQAWFIGIGLAVAAIGGWFALGQPGASLEDGDYGCEPIGQTLITAGPGATVDAGEVIDVWDFDMRTGERTSLPWSNAERRSPTEFTIRAASPLDPDGPLNMYTCTP